MIFVRDTRETGIKRLSVHSDDGLNTNLELRLFCFFDVRVFNPYAPSNRQPLIVKARPTMLAFRLYSSYNFEMLVWGTYNYSYSSLGHHSLIPCFLSRKEVLVYAGGRLLLLFIILIK